MIECYKDSCPEHPGDEPFCPRDRCIECPSFAVWPNGDVLPIDDREFTGKSDDYQVVHAFDEEDAYQLVYPEASDGLCIQEADYPT